MTSLIEKIWKNLPSKNVETYIFVIAVILTITDRFFDISNTIIKKIGNNVLDELNDYFLIIVKCLFVTALILSVILYLTGTLSIITNNKFHVNVDTKKTIDWASSCFFDYTNSSCQWLISLVLISRFLKLDFYTSYTCELKIALLCILFVAPTIIGILRDLNFIFIEAPLLKCKSFEKQGNNQ